MVERHMSKLKKTSGSLLQERAAKKRFGTRMMVVLPDRSILPAWRFWVVIHSDLPGKENLIYLTDEMKRIEALYERHIPELAPEDRPRRAFRLAMKSMDFEIRGVNSDHHDLKILALANGLSEGEFSVVQAEKEPLLCMDAEAIRKLGAAPGDSLSLH
ncbi:hypothetical protein [Methylobacterium tarhaniae]|uniref:hypothetical protein n=1 Tax=Methylobacterium tarhaniae TaxID=1187852 RepID=UPI003D039F7E